MGLLRTSSALTPALALAKNTLPRLLLTSTAGMLPDMTNQDISPVGRLALIPLVLREVTLALSGLNRLQTQPCTLNSRAHKPMRQIMVPKLQEYPMARKVPLPIQLRFLNRKFPSRIQDLFRWGIQRQAYKRTNKPKFSSSLRLNTNHHHNNNIWANLSHPKTSPLPNSNPGRRMRMTQIAPTQTRMCKLGPHITRKVAKNLRGLFTSSQSLA